MSLTDGRTVDRLMARYALRLSLLPVPRPLRTSSDEFIDNASDSAADPETYYVYINGVITGWYLAALTTGLLMVALAYLGSALAGHSGRTVGVVFGVGITVFCIVGAADATWRALLVRTARGHAGRWDGEKSDRVLRAAQARYPRLAFQVMAGVIAAILTAFLL